MRDKESRIRNLMWLSEQSLELVNVFKEASCNLHFFLFNKAGLNFKNHLCMYRKYLFNSTGPDEQFSSGDPIPLRKGGGVDKIYNRLQPSGYF
jgi:hypothetical protein